ncbi:GerAB/ArcD/ProY family transporter [Cohnella panacarvi]|uniref:GerAB/ArcD/ProY family transporter n=1 Tax=Cohnella panacarvi TaxID=400776 RepID=UPI00047C0BD1|nr:endospore germination permease [Cohnella panacarvi]
MKPFDYADAKIGTREMAILISSIILGVGVLTMPRSIAQITKSSDGWVSILIAGAIAIFFALIASKLASKFPGRTFYEFASSVVTKPIAIVITAAFSAYFIGYGAYETRMIANISKQYLFDQTPVEVIAFVFIAVMAYSVSGTQIALLRLNVLFLPIVLFILLFVLVFSTNLFEVNHLKPFFVTKSFDLIGASKESVFSFLGFEMVLFYAFLMRKPAKAPIASVIGVLIPLVLYLLVYIIAIGVFTNEGTANVQYPTVELAKEVELPGEFFERFESLFFTIWIMTVFNTASISIDVALACMRSILVSVRKPVAISGIIPVVYFIGMTPQTIGEVSLFGEWLSYIGIVLVGVVPTSLLIVSKARGIKGNG